MKKRADRRGDISLVGLSPNGSNFTPVVGKHPSLPARVPFGGRTYERTSTLSLLRHGAQGGMPSVVIPTVGREEDGAGQCPRSRRVPFFGVSPQTRAPLSLCFVRTNACIPSCLFGKAVQNAQINRLCFERGMDDRRERSQHCLPCVGVHVCRRSAPQARGGPGISTKKGLGRVCHHCLRLRAVPDGLSLAPRLPPSALSSPPWPPSVGAFFFFIVRQSERGPSGQSAIIVSRPTSGDG